MSTDSQGIAERMSSLIWVVCGLTLLVFNLWWSVPNLGMGCTFQAGPCMGPAFALYFGIPFAAVGAIVMMIGIHEMKKARA